MSQIELGGKIKDEGINTGVYDILSALIIIKDVYYNG
jgi:hypothetical protein